VYLGSVLDSILFLEYVNDIDSVCCNDTTLQLFADDAKLYSSVRLGGTVTSYQQSLDRLTQWATVWQLSINIINFSVLILSAKPLSSHTDHFNNGILIPRQNSYVGLKVTIFSNLSFEAHINKIVSETRQRISIFFRGFLSRNLCVIWLAFASYIHKCKYRISVRSQ
jgi:hypothetical protein